MRSLSVAVAALIGSAAANPMAWDNYGYGGEYNPYPTGSVPSSSSSSTTPSSTVVPPTGGSTPPPYSTGVSPPPTTDTITTYTTETVCPVTKTYGTQVITTLTTSTITITSCKGGCHHKPTYTPTAPTYPGGPVTKTETITTTTYTWVPCSSPVGQNGPSVIYSTYLTASYYPTTYVTEKVYTPTAGSQPPAVTPPAVTPPVVTPVNVPSQCPTQSTVTVTVYPQNPQPCHYCETKTYTITEGGYTHTFTTTYTPTSIPTYQSQPPSSTPKGHSTPVPTGGSSYTPTGYVPYPTHSHHSSSTPYSSGNVGPKPTDYGYQPW